MMATPGRHTAKAKGSTPEWPVDSIKIGPRHRKDLGDIDGLAASMHRKVLQPIAVTPDGQLVAGRRRLEAARKLGWRTVPVHVVTGLDDRLSLLRAERDENVCRKEFTPTEAVSIGREIEGEIAAEAKKRQGRPGQPRSAKLGEHDGKGETQEQVAEIVGMGRENYRKARTVVMAAEAEPEKYGHLLKVLDEGNVDTAYGSWMYQQRHQEREAAMSPQDRQDESERQLRAAREGFATNHENAVRCVLVCEYEKATDEELAYFMEPGAPGTKTWLTAEHLGRTIAQLKRVHTLKLSQEAAATAGGGKAKRGPKGPRRKKRG
jgi:ParB family chromosome partitioning protein